MISVGFKRVSKKRPCRTNQSVPRASLEIRNAVFQELIRISPASNYMEELVAGPGGLLSRGLIEADATRYGALPFSQGFNSFGRIDLYGS